MDPTRTLFRNTTRHLNVAILVLVATTAAWAQAGFSPTPPEPVAAREFPIMAWGMSPSDAGQRRWMKEAGLNVSGFCRVEALDLVAAAGLSCIVHDQRTSNRDGENLPGEAKLRKEIEWLAGEIRGKPQVLGVYLQAEPNAAAIPGMGRLAALLRESLPGTLAYVNLYSPYTSTGQLGSMKPMFGGFST
jgi:hypothetical protein